MDYQWNGQAGHPPVIVTAERCSGDITINVKYVVEAREHNTLQQLAEAIQARLEGKGPCPLMR